MKFCTHRIILLIAVAAIISAGISNVVLPHCLRSKDGIDLTAAPSEQSAPCTAVCCSTRGTRTCHQAVQENTASEAPERKAHCSGLCPCCRHFPVNTPFLPTTSSDSVRLVPQIAALTINASFDTAMSQAICPYPNFSSNFYLRPIYVMHYALLC